MPQLVHDVLGAPLAPADLGGIKAWTVDPLYCGSSQGDNFVKAVAVWLDAGVQLGHMAVYLEAAGVSMQHAQLGIYDSTLALPAATADTPAPFGVGANAFTWLALALAAPYTTPAAGVYYFAFTQAATTVCKIANAPGIGNALPGATYARAIKGATTGLLPNPLVDVAAGGGFGSVPCIIAW